MIRGASPKTERTYQGRPVGHGIHAWPERCETAGSRSDFNEERAMLKAEQSVDTTVDGGYLGAAEGWPSWNPGLRWAILSEAHG